VRRGTAPGLAFDLEVFDDGKGPALYVGGEFTAAGAVPANNIAKWDGRRWWPLGEGITANGEVQITSLEVYDDGTGPALYVGGRFDFAGGLAATSIARWTGVHWAALGSGVQHTYPPWVSGLRVFNDGTGWALYVCGEFTAAGGVPANFIAKWNGTGWGPLGAGTNASTVDMAVFNNGTADGLYVGGAFTAAGGLAVSGVARWDGAAWAPVGSGVERGPVSALRTYPPARPGLYIGGLFARAGPCASAHVGRWTCVPGWTPGDLNCDGAVNYLDVDPFVWAVIDRAQFEARFPGCLWFNGDINADNRVDFGDINPLVELLRR